MEKGYDEDLERSEQDLTRCDEEIRATLHAAGWLRPVNETRCLVPACHCEAFLDSQSDSSNLLICARTGCGHVWLRHYSN